MSKFKRNFSVISEFMLVIFVIANAIYADKFKILMIFWSFCLFELISIIHQRFRSIMDQWPKTKPYSQRQATLLMSTPKSLRIRAVVAIVGVVFKNDSTAVFRSKRVQLLNGN